MSQMTSRLSEHITAYFGVIGLKLVSVFGQTVHPMQRQISTHCPWQVRTRAINNHYGAIFRRTITHNEARVSSSLRSPCAPSEYIVPIA
jgi:hypothetical protein